MDCCVFPTFPRQSFKGNIFATILTTLSWSSGQVPLSKKLSCCDLDSRWKRFILTIFLDIWEPWIKKAGIICAFRFGVARFSIKFFFVWEKSQTMQNDDLPCTRPPAAGDDDLYDDNSPPNVPTPASVGSSSGLLSPALLGSAPVTPAQTPASSVTLGSFLMVPNGLNVGHAASAAAQLLSIDQISLVRSSCAKFKCSSVEGSTYRLQMWRQKTNWPVRGGDIGSSK